MAHAVTTRAWLTALGNTTEAIANAIIDQGLTLTELGELEPNDVSVMCQVARRPGGTITGGTPNPGVNVPAMLQMKLNIAVHAARYYDDVGRTITPAIMGWARIKQFKSLKEAVEKWDDPSDLPELGRDMPIMQLLELIREHLKGSLE